MKIYRLPSLAAGQIPTELTSFLGQVRMCCYSAAMLTRWQLPDDESCTCISRWSACIVLSYGISCIDVSGRNGMKMPDLVQFFG